VNGVSSSVPETPQYPNVVGNPKLAAASGSVNGWFNTAAFASPGAGALGDMRRNSVYGPSLNLFNASMHKVFPIWESTKFDLSVSAQTS
jgi:hypothetical protein